MDEAHPLFDEDMVERVRPLLDGLFHGVERLGRPPDPAAPLDEGEVTSRAAEELAELGRFGEPFAAQSFQDSLEGLLVEVFGELRRSAEAPQQEAEAAAVALDELGLGR